ncbi:hypothetical protein HZC30_02945 [Candidatus Woesearchaeota archaeon]|nr:hypothetical protein [Candidatus Woesearchaeota archaeon]
MINAQKSWSFIGLFIIALVISMPFYSADALASIEVKITKNSGTGGIENYLDAQGDVWTVEALITGVNDTTIDPQKVKLKIGDNEAVFSSCSGGTLGQTCQYISPLTDGIKEAEYAFNVVYEFLDVFGVPDSAQWGDYIRADGSAPTISSLSAKQEKGDVIIDFTVTDKKAGVPAVGLKQLDIIDADSNAILQSITDFKLEEHTASYTFKDDTKFGGKLQAVLEGEGTRRIKVSAEDWLGHKSVNLPLATFKTDFVAPVLVKDTLNFTSLGKFIGPYNVQTDIKLDVLETTTPIVTAYSDQAELTGEEASCSLDDEVDKLWHCEWSNIEVHPFSTVALKVTAIDEYENTVEETLNTDLVEDTSAPEISFFGTERQFEGKSYVKMKGVAGENRLILKANEQGSGMAAEDVRANMGALGKSQYEPPTGCNQTESTFDCYWDFGASLSSGGVLRVGLSKFEDKVGNVGAMPEIEIVADNSPPKVEKLEFYGTSDIGDKDYFQSNDKIKIKTTIIESSGAFILVNLNDIAMDAETKFPEGPYTRDLGAGWQVFDAEQSCERSNDTTKWFCEVETEAIKSGPEKNVKLEVVVTDTAGNMADSWPESAKNMETKAQEGTYSFDLLGLSVEDNPDYWEVDKVVPKLDFVDLDATKVAYTRMPLEIRFKTSHPNTKVLSVELIPNSCAKEGEEPAPEISRSVMYGGSMADGAVSPVKTMFTLEFSPFEGRGLFGLSKKAEISTVEAKYTCKFKLYSQVGKDALAAAEMQDVIVSVPFGFSKLGAIDENLADKVKELKGSGFMKFANVLNYLKIALDWINYIFNILKIIITVNQIIDLISGTATANADAYEKSGVLAGVGAGLRGSCLAYETDTGAGWEYIQYIQIPLQILNCNPDPDHLGWYGDYQAAVLKNYNRYTGRELLGTSASLYENMYLSIAGLCLPGIIFNIDKAREIHCRKIVCYGREVPQGIATIDSCNKLYDLQMCEFVWGPVMDLIPFLGALGQIGQMIKSAFTSPMGLITLTETAACFTFCFTTGGGPLLITCKVTAGINKALDIVNSIIGAFKNRPDVTGSPYCKMADSIDADELTGGKDYAPVEESEPESAPPSEAAPSQPASPPEPVAAI